MGTPEEGEEGLLMDIITGRDGDVDNWKEVILIYSSALKQIGTKLEILNDEFQHVHSYNPIEHIKSRIKTAESIVKKLRRYGYESTISNMVEYINDIAGIRVICSFMSDIYRIDFGEGLSEESEAERLSQLSYDCDGSGIFVRPDCGYEGGDPDPDSSDGFLGKLRA